ncbi:MFS transporter [Gammaproteobacteria bacterium]|nr:MFS transporter [Gammaproteobacteria bacterium]
MNIQSIYNLVIPNELKNNIVEYTYSKSLVANVLISMIACIIVASLYYYFDIIDIFISILIEAVLILFIIFSLRLTKSVHITRELLLVSYFILLTFISFKFQGLISPSSLWYASIPLICVINGGRLTGLVVTMAMLGGLVAQTPLALLSNWIGWKYAVLMDAGLGIIIFIAIALVVQDYPPEHHEKHAADKAHLQSLGFFKSIGLVILNPQNWYGGIYTALMNLPVFLLGALWGIHYLMQAHNLTLMQGSYATTLFFVGIILGSPFFGWMSDHIGRRVLPMMLGAVLSLSVMLILLFLPNLSFVSILFLFFLVGFITSSQVLSYPTVAELNPTSLTSTAVSIVSTVIMLSGVIFQPLFGLAMQWHWDHKVIDGAPIYSSSDMLNAMLIMPIAFVVALIVTCLIKETFCKLKEFK